MHGHRKKTYLTLSMAFMGLGVTILLFVIYGPRDYLEYMPKFLQTALHPYTLVFISELLLACGLGAFATWVLKAEDPDIRK